MKSILFITSSNNVKEASFHYRTGFFNEDEVKPYFFSIYSFEYQKELYEILNQGKNNSTSKKIIKPIFTRAVTLFAQSFPQEQLVVLTDSPSIFCSIVDNSNECYFGNLVNCSLDGINFNLGIIPNYKSSFANPIRTKENINITYRAVDALFNGRVISFDDNIHEAIYPSTVEEIKAILERLMTFPALTCDIETWSLKHYNSGIASIGFAWNSTSGCSFLVDYSKDRKNQEKRDLLTWFFTNYKGKLIFHNITYDVYILIYQLFMKNLTDIEGLLHGLNIFNNYEDTMIIAYLATNSCGGNSLGLKSLSFEYTGKYALDNITNLDKVDTPTLLKYNLIDVLATWYVYDKYHPIMVNDQQERVYNTIMLPAIKDIIQMQLTGLPLDMNQVKIVSNEISRDREEAKEAIETSPLIDSFNLVLKENIVNTRNKKLKVKRITVADVSETFNVNSGKQLREFLYNFLKLPVLDKTDSGVASTSKDTLEKLVKTLPDNEEIISLLKSIIAYKEADKILTTFIPAFENSIPVGDGTNRLYGSFHLTGTVSGRLSSSNINLQTIPATGTKYAKAIKSCFKAPNGWIFCGLDYNSLEDYISALTTRDRNKMKIYEDGYDSHCLRSYSYFTEDMPDITNELNHLEQLDGDKVIKLTYQDGRVEYHSLTEPEMAQYLSTNN